MNNQKSDTIIIIPCLNEEKSLPLVLRTIHASPEFFRIIDIIVVDNGSTDQSTQIAKELGAMVLHEPRRGYGSACIAGRDKALEIGCDYLLFLDADFSDDPLEFPLLLKELDLGRDLVIGSRMRGKAEKGSLLPQAYLGNKLAVFLIHYFFKGKKFTDLGPFRAIRSDMIKELDLKDKNFGWTIEMQIKAILHNIDYTEVSVSYRKRIGQSKITGTVFGTIAAGSKIIFCIFYFFIKFRLFKGKG